MDINSIFQIKDKNIRYKCEGLLMIEYNNPIVYKNGFEMKYKEFIYTRNPIF